MLRYESVVNIFVHSIFKTNSCLKCMKERFFHNRRKLCFNLKNLFLHLKDFTFDKTNKFI